MFIFPVGFLKKVVSGETYVTTAVNFSGTTELRKFTDLVGNVDGKVGMASGWFRVDGRAGTQRTMQSNTTSFNIGIDSSNKFFVQCLSVTTAAQIVNLLSTTTFPVSADWHHFVASWDVTDGSGKVYIDDVDVTSGTVSVSALDIDYTQTLSFIGASGFSTNRFDGCMSELYVNYAETLDLTVESNRRKFIDANGKPVELGDGSAPTGTSPIIMLSGDNTEFYINKGTGGDYAITGTLANCSTSPSDIVRAVEFDGTNDYLTRTTDLVGNVDGSTGLISFWFKMPASTSGSIKTIYSNLGDYCLISKEGADTLFFDLQDDIKAPVTNLLKANISAQLDDQWHHCIASWDTTSLTAGNQRIYIDDVSVHSGTPAKIAPADFTRAGHRIGSFASGSFKFQGCMAEFFLENNTTGYIDLSITANRRKFIDASGNPVELGSDGSTPFGSSPPIFLSGNKVDFPLNSGDGGAFSEVGAIDTCATDPFV